MPKVKTHSGASKRFRLTANGHVKRTHEGKNHILTKKDRKRLRGLKKIDYVDAAQERTMKRLVPYK